MKNGGQRVRLAGRQRVVAWQKGCLDFREFHLYPGACRNVVSEGAFLGAPSGVTISR